MKVKCHTMTKKQVMINYLLLNVELEDWHGVTDAAVDIREMVAKGIADEPLSINLCE